MRTQLRKINNSTLAGILIVLGFTISILVIPSYSSVLSYKNYSWYYDIGQNVDDQVINMQISYDGSYFLVSTTSSLLLFQKSILFPIWLYDNVRYLFHISITLNGNYFAGGNSDYLYVFSREGSNINLRFVKPSDSIGAVDFSRNGNFFVVTDSKTLYLYSTSTFLPLWAFTSEKNFDEAEISADGSYIVASDGSYLYLFSKFSNIPLWKFSLDGYVHRLAFSANGKYIVVGEYIKLGKNPKTLYLFERESNLPIWSRDFGRYITSVAISDDGSVIAAGNSEGLVSLFSSTSSIPIFTFNAPWSIQALSLSSNGKNIAVISAISYACLMCAGCPCPKNEGELYVFNLESPYTSWWYNMNDYISFGAISSDGRSVLVGSFDKVYYFQNKL